MLHMIMKCPVRVDDDICEQEISINCWKAEPATWNYPGSPRDFEVDGCSCGHRDLIETKYSDEVWEEVREMERAQEECAADSYGNL